MAEDGEVDRGLRNPHCKQAGDWGRTGYGAQDSVSAKGITVEMAGVSEEEVLGSTEEEESEGAPEAAGAHGLAQQVGQSALLKPMDRVLLHESSVRSMQGLQERATPGEPFTSSLERLREGGLERVTAVCSEDDPGRSGFEERVSDLELGAWKSTGSNVKLDRVDVENTHNASLKATGAAGVCSRVTEDVKRGGLLSFAEAIEDNVQPVPDSLAKMRSENNTQPTLVSSALVLEKNTTYASYVTMAADGAPAVARLTMVAGDEEAQSAPASPTKVVADEGAHLLPASPVKVSLWSTHKASPGKGEEAETTLSAKKSHFRLVEEEEEAEMAPTHSALVDDEEAEMAPASDKETVLQHASIQPLKDDSLIRSLTLVKPEDTSLTSNPNKHDLEILDNSKTSLASVKSIALESQRKNTAIKASKDPNSFLNEAAECRLLESQKKGNIGTRPTALDIPHELIEGGATQTFKSLSRCASDECHESSNNGKKRLVEEDSEILTRHKKQAVEEISKTSASPNAAFELQTMASKHILTSPYRYGVENREYTFNPKKRPSDEHEMFGSPKKRATEEETSLPNLGKQAVEERLETSTIHATTEDDDDDDDDAAAEAASENMAVCAVSDDGTNPHSEMAKGMFKVPCTVQRQVTNVLNPHGVLAVTPSLQNQVIGDCSLIQAISDNRLLEDRQKTSSVIEHQGGEDLSSLSCLKEQMTGAGPWTPSVSEGKASEDGLSVPSGPPSSGSEGLGQSPGFVADGSRAWSTLTVAETDDTEDTGEDCAQEYPGSPMDLDDDESSNNCENLVVTEIPQTETSSGYLVETAQGVQAASDIAGNQNRSLSIAGCNGTDSGTGASAYASYLGHGGALYPGSDAGEGSLPLPQEFDKYWKATEDNPSDFTAWTDLLEYLEQANHIIASRKAYAAFFTRYPYCYGYWKKYADMEQRFGCLKEAEEVFEQGVQAIPLSVDLWIHFITFLQETFDLSQPESIQRITNVFEMALAAAGMDFHSDKLWEMYVDWEKQQGDLQAITVIYDRVLSTPTHLYSHHFEKFKEHVTSNSPADILSREEFIWLRSKLVPEAAPATVNTGTGDQLQGHGGSEEAAQIAEIEKPVCLSDVDKQKMRELIISLREQMYKQNEAEVSKRWTFEEAIKRPYFHVKPLERAQLINWRNYLDFEISCGSHSRTIVLFERCVIACALYEEFWLKYTKYLETHTVIGTRSVFQRSSLYHLPKKPNLHLLWAAFEERQGEVDEARNILKTLDEAVPGLAMVRLRRVSLERRLGNLEAAEALLREAILANEGTQLATFYSIKLARQVLKVQNNLSKARDVLQEALQKDPENAKLYLNLLEMEFSADVKQNESNTVNCIERVLRSNLPADTKIVFSQRRVEFLEDFGSSINGLLTAYDEHQKLLKLQAPKRKVTENGAEEPEEKVKSEDAPTPAVVTAASSTAFMAGDMSNSQVAASAAYNYNTWYQNYGAYNYPNTWNYNYYPQS
ncbi:uncharacterized protein [Ambystoma mexicanum]|uniref:uncharacterized protein isoform X2 n=1 Tax=Ambystoma mexicanum TaxID=8296 RepID=UPI0037E8C892